MLENAINNLITKIGKNQLDRIGDSVLFESTLHFQQDGVRYSSPVMVRE